MRALESVEIAEGEARMMMGRANGAGDQCVARPFVGAEDFRPGDFLLTVETGGATPDRPLRRKSRAIGHAKTVSRHHRVDDFAVAGTAAEHAAERVLRLALVWRKV